MAKDNQSLARPEVELVKKCLSLNHMVDLLSKAGHVWPQKPLVAKYAEKQTNQSGNVIFMIGGWNSASHLSPACG